MTPSALWSPGNYIAHNSIAHDTHAHAFPHRPRCRRTLAPAGPTAVLRAVFVLAGDDQALRDRYIEPAKPKGLHLIPASVEAEIASAPDAKTRARLVCDWIANMTDRFAFRTYRRLFDADFGSITDFV